MGIRDTVEFQSFLSDGQLSKLHSMLPETDNKICIACSAIIRFNGEEFTNGFVVLTPYSIYFFKKSFSFTLLARVNFIIINAYVTSKKSSDGFLVQSKNYNVIVKGQYYMQLSQILHRNYHLIVNKLLNFRQAEYSTNSCEDFPDITSPITLSQQLQFSYALYCAKFDEEYDHDFVHMMWKKLSSFDFTFDLSAVPEATGTKSACAAASVLGLWTCFICQKPTCHEPVKGLVEFLKHCPTVRMVSITAPHDKEDLDSVVDLIKKNPEREIYSWEMGGGSFGSINKFIKLFSIIKTDIKVIDFSGADLEEKSTTLLLKCLAENHHMWKLQKLGLRGCKLESKAKKAFYEWQSVLSKNKEQNLTELSLAKTGNYVGKVCFIICSFNQPLRVLDISDNKLSEWAEGQVIQLVMRTPTLVSLDISGCNFDVTSITNITRTLVSDTKKENLKLKMSKMRLSGTDVAGAVSAVLDCDVSKWRCIELNHIKFDIGSARMILSIFNSLNRLASISLSGCFNSKLAGIGERVAHLLDIPTLQKLVISGVDKGRLKHEAYPLLEKIADNNTLEYLDVSNNKIGPEGIDILRKSLLRNKSIKYIDIDQNLMTDIETINKFIRVYRARPESMFMPFPCMDAKKIIDSASKSSRDSTMRKLKSIEDDLCASLSLHRLTNAKVSKSSVLLTPYIKGIIEEETNGLVAVNKHKNMSRYTTFNNILNLPYPFQEKIASPVDIQPDEELDDSKFAVYETPSLSTVVNFKYVIDSDITDVKEELASIENKTLTKKEEESTNSTTKKDPPPATNEKEQPKEKKKKKKYKKENAAKKKKKAADSTKSSSDESEEVVINTPLPGAIPKVELSSSSESELTPSFDPPPKRIAKKIEPESDSDESSDEVKPVKKVAKQKKGVVLDSDTEESSDEPVMKPKKSPAKQRITKEMISSDSDSDDFAQRFKPRHGTLRDSSSSSDSEFDDYIPPKKSPKKVIDMSIHGIDSSQTGSERMPLPIPTRKPRISMDSD